MGFGRDVPLPFECGDHVRQKLLHGMCSGVGVSQVTQGEGGVEFCQGEIVLHGVSLRGSCVEGEEITLSRCTGRTPAAAVMRATRSPCGRKAAEG
ncbi:hypothetical protein D9M72_520260 [compost metagenome]